MKLIKGLIILFIVLGGGLVIVGFATGGSISNIFDAVTNDEDYILQDTITYQDTLTSLEIDVETKVIIITGTDDSEISIDHYEADDETWSIEMSSGVLTITQKDPAGIGSWFSWSFVSKARRTIKVNIPNEYLFDVNVTSNTGDIDLSGFSLLGDVSIDTDTGDVNVNHVNSNSVYLESNTGKIYLTNAEVNGKATLTTDTGDASMINSSADAVDIEVNTGDVTVETVVANKFDLQSDTGDVDVVGVDLDNRSVYMQTDTGKTYFKGQSQGNEFNLVLNDVNFYINATTDTGNVRITE